MNDMFERKVEGEFDSNNKKTGVWIEYAKYQEIGYYTQGRRTGTWIIVHDGKQIGEGEFDENNQQTGQWVEFSNDYLEIGHYRQGKRIGIWELLKGGNTIGVGKFDENKEKTGKWMEFIQNDVEESKVISVQQGHYSQGKRAGKWQILRDGEIIGEGELDENHQKRGQWIEYSSLPSINITDSETGLCFSQKISYYQQIGSYHKGLRTGIWKVFKDDQQIGEGEFDHTNQKTGKWIEQNSDLEVGEYYQGKRKGVWKVYRNEQMIGEGEFDDNNQRTGEWKVYEDTRISEKVLLFFDKSVNFNLTFIGEYRNGEKYGIWKAFDTQGKRILIADAEY